MTNPSPPPDQTPGHGPTLIASFIHFDFSFMLWVLLGALGIYITESLGLNTAQKAMVVAAPILSGSLLRLPLGLLSDRIGAKRVGTAMLAFLFLPLTFGWLAGGSLPALLAVGLMLGTAGASFAVALPLASRWYPPSRQGLVMGIAAAGNSGTAITNLLAPRLAEQMGWHNVLGCSMLPLAVVLAAFVLMARDNPSQVKRQPVRNYLLVLKQSDLWWFCLFYSVTFGGYVGLCSFLPLFFRDQYQVTPITAGYLTAVAALSGSLVRPLGGYLADRLGGVRMLSVLLALIGAAYFLIAQLPSLRFAAVMIAGGMVCLGMGNGAVFQIVPQRFRHEIGVASGMVGAAGGIGGFLLPNLLGQIKYASGSYRAGFLTLAVIASAATALLRLLVVVRQGWRFSWNLSQPAE
ncbi:MAG TPA: nitrate/nitrite transporter [Blastocatellia bacterium]|nr:nitrate/nitrite transporter [Blastocatellia bacterium]